MEPIECNTKWNENRLRVAKYKVLTVLTTSMYNRPTNIEL